MAILIPVKLTGIQKSWGFQSYGLPSIIKTIETGYNYTLVLGVDSQDHRGVSECNKVTGLRTVVLARPDMQPFTRAVNEMAKYAHSVLHADYMVRINDDTKLLSAGWTTMAITTLKSLSDIGVVGPTHREGNTGILVFDFVSRRHYDIHGFYYPPELSNWWADDWITKVYEPDRTVKLKRWRTKHVGTHGVRYKIDSKDERKLLRLIERGKLRISETLGIRNNVISYSLYGSNPRYTDGAIANANLSQFVYPGWEMRVYHDSKVPSSILDSLRRYPHVKLVPMDKTNHKNPMVWRFFVASDPKVERYIVRDIDSRLSARERAAVIEWIRSGRKFHIMRDHPSHSAYPISGGMWGGTRDAIPSMKSLIGMVKSSSYLADMNFLNKVMWARAKTSLWQNDAFSCKQYNAAPFPVKRIGLEHIGGVFIDGALRKEDTQILAKAKSRCPEEFPGCSTLSWDTIPPNKDLVKTGIRSSPIARLLASIPDPAPGHLVVDIGANMGHFSTAIVDRWPNAPHAIVEAIPWYASNLKKKFTRATIHNVAVSDTPGTFPIYGDRSWKSHSVHHTGASLLIRGSGYKTTIASVKTTTLDSMYPTETIHFLKIDTEGMDARVIRGADRMLSEKRIKTIYWENNKMQNLVNDTLFKTVLYLKSKGYSNYAVGPDLYSLDDCPGDREWFYEYPPTGNVLSRLAMDSRRPYPVTLVEWGSCSTPWTRPKSWYIVTSADTNTNYLGFLPSVAEHWERRGLTVVLALVTDDNLTVPLPESVVVHRLKIPPGVDKGHAAKLARLFVASRLDGLVTIVDIDYYLVWFRQWTSHFGCVDLGRSTLVSLGYNRYKGTPDEGKFPMYLTTATGATFRKVVGDVVDFADWIRGYRGRRVFDAKESPYGTYGTFSDESLLRSELATSSVVVVWINTPSSWRRIDRAQTHPIKTSELSKCADVFPNRPIDNCQIYKTRLLPVHRFLGIDNTARDSLFVRELRRVQMSSRDWGSSRHRQTRTLDCLGRVVWTGGAHPDLEMVHTTHAVRRKPPNKSILGLCPKLNPDVFWECQGVPMPCSDYAFVARIKNAFVGDNRVHADVPGTIFTNDTTFRWQVYVRDVPSGHPSRWKSPPRIQRFECLGSVLQAYPSARGHFPHEGLPRLLYLRQHMPPECPILVHNSSFSDRYLVGIPNLIAWRPKTVYAARDVYVANEAPYCRIKNPHNGGMSTFFQPEVMALVRRHFGSVASRNTTVVIRRKGPREYAEHESLVDLLTRTGHKVTVFTADGQLEDHIRMFQRASTVVGPHGAGFSNLVFCHPGTRVVEIGWDGKAGMEMDNMYARVSASLDLDYRLVIGRGNYNGRISLDPSEIVRALA